MRRSDKHLPAADLGRFRWNGSLNEQSSNQQCEFAISQDNKDPHTRKYPEITFMLFIMNRKNYLSDYYDHAGTFLHHISAA